MTDLLNNIYLPDLKKKNLLNSDAYRLLKDNGQDPTALEGFEKDNNLEPIEIVEDIKPEDKKNYLKAFGNFLTETTEDTL